MYFSTMNYYNMLVLFTPFQDIILHVRDISHPDTEIHKVHVLEAVHDLVPSYKLNSMIEVCNKVDCINE